MDHVKQSKGAGDVDACRSSDVARSRPNVVLENPQFDESELIDRGPQAVKVDGLCLCCIQINYCI